ncbi:hypothetical protein Ciccas_010197 [Cichlidogyrus casuarinus]|uniref:Uncharacterized protein n=1 Tax=Cichlidogyrus casuarinus TaxID=1844966 RepID=A0ABD2PZE4_9PLAT
MKRNGRSLLIPSSSARNRQSADPCSCLPDSCHRMCAQQEEGNEEGMLLQQLRIPMIRGNLFYYFH